MLARLQLSNGEAALRADTSRYNIETQSAGVIGPVYFAGPDNYRLTTRDVTVDLNGQTLRSHGSVEGTMPLGRFSADRLQIIFKLRSGTVWPNRSPVNGREFDSSDVVANWERYESLTANNAAANSNNINPAAPIVATPASLDDHTGVPFTSRPSESTTQARRVAVSPRTRFNAVSETATATGSVSGVAVESVQDSSENAAPALKRILWYRIVTPLAPARDPRLYGMCCSVMCLMDPVSLAITTKRAKPRHLGCSWSQRRDGRCITERIRRAETTGRGR